MGVHLNFRVGDGDGDGDNMCGDGDREDGDGVGMGTISRGWGCKFIPMSIFSCRSLSLSLRGLIIPLSLNGNAVIMAGARMVGAGAVGSAAAPVYPSLHIVRLMELTAQIANKPDLQPLSNSGLPQHSLTETREFLHALKAIPHKLHNGKFTPWRKDTHAHLHVHVTRQLSDLLLL